MEPIKIGSRDSRLAVLQSKSVMAALHLAGYQTELITMKTTGDKILDRTLDKIGGKGLFVKELDAALRDGRADFTVHSLKDMPMDTPDDLPILAVSPRADVRDVLVLPQGTTHWDRDKPVGCSSARRRIQLQRLFPKLQIEPVRGNIQTRLRKLDEGKFGALILAAAGLIRLGLQQRIHQFFSVEEILPAAGQAIIAVQGRAGVDSSCLSGYCNTDAWDCMIAERAFVRALGGGCSSPIAAYAEMTQQGKLWLRGMYVDSTETVVRFEERYGEPCNATEIGKMLAMSMLNGGTTI